MNYDPSARRRFAIGFASAGTMMTILFLVIVNYITGSRYPWFIYPTFAILWWPLSVIFARRYPKAFSVFGSLLIIVFLIITNLTFSPGYLWVLYAVYPVLCWPVILFLGRRAARLPAALAVSCVGICYYLFLNVFYAPGFPWFIFPAYVLLWWPLAAALGKRIKALQFSLAGTFLTILFFIVLNAVTTPQLIWAVFPIFAILWWPLTIYFFVYTKQKIVH